MTLRFYIILLFCINLFTSYHAAKSAEPMMSDREKEITSQMGQIYAQHIFTAHCKRSYGFYLTDLGDGAIAKSPDLSKTL